MSRDSSPRPMSDDSAIGSMPSILACNGNSSNSNIQRNNQFSDSSVCNNINQARSQINNARITPSNHHDQSPQDTTNPHDQHSVSRTKLSVRPEELRMVSHNMRYNNTTMLSRSIRTNLTCFDDLDMERLDFPSDYLINFKSIGINRSQHLIQRPVSILWPDTYDKMIDELSKLDAMLINTEYKEKPIEWLLQHGMTNIPECRACKNQMTLCYERNNVLWKCSRTQPCQNLYSPIQRPFFFKGYESIGLMKIMFSIYYWSICTPCDLLLTHLKVEAQTLHAMFQSIQNVCRVALEKSYPRFRLCNNPNNEVAEGQRMNELIDLISVRLNNSYIVCAKHPRSNCVRLGLVIPKVSLYSFADLTESWFAHGAKIRVCEKKFLDLKKKRTDLMIDLVSRSDMVTKRGQFDRDSAFGYLICQLTHTLKDFDSTQVPIETLKLILAEIEWRELYGTNPYDAFTKIVEHMATYKGSSERYHEINWASGEAQKEDGVISSEYIFAEKYFYAVLQPADANGKPTQRYGAKQSLYEAPIPIVQFRCHLCSFQFESLYFTMHMIAHVEKNRRDSEEAEFVRTKRIRCKHCFKKLKKSTILQHSELFRCDYHSVKFGCRICCVGFPDRSKYLEHMRRQHFEHEMPYRCPSCKFASSFQRDLFIHFQEEHQTEYVIWCPFCSRSFTIAEPTKFDSKKMQQVSKVIYDHILEHHSVADSYACDSCCLSFLSRAKLNRHKALHHNPMEMLPETGVILEPFIVARQEEPYCVRALQMELFIPNKRPNISIDEQTQVIASTSTFVQTETDPKDIYRRANLNASNSLGSGSIRRPKSSTMCPVSSSSSDDSSDDDEKEKNPKSLEKGAIHVRSANVAKKFLQGGQAAIHVPKTKPNVELSTEKIIEYFSRLERADCVIPNQSVVLTPSGRPARCVECLEFITVDHYVAAIPCKHCKYTTHCPLAATRHRQARHTSGKD